MIRNAIGKTAAHPVVNPNLARVTGNPTSTSTLIQRNPILHQSNRIVTVGLLSSYGKTGQRSFQSATKPQFTPKEEISSTVIDELSKQPQLTLYKSHDKPEKGGAVSLKYHHASRSVFFDSAPQKGEKLKPGVSGSQYDWENKLTLKVVTSELGKLLTVLNGIEQSIELSHPTSSLKLEKRNKSQDFLVTLIKGKDEKKIEVVIDSSDAVLMTEFLRCAIRSALGFF